MPASHHSIFNKPDALPDAQPTVSKHGKQQITHLRHMTKLCLKTANKITFFMAPQLLHIIANKCFFGNITTEKEIVTVMNTSQHCKNNCQPQTHTG